MAAYILRRLLQGVPVVFFSTLLVFVMVHLLPGDPAATLAGPNANAEQVAVVRHNLGLDQPLVAQYGEWIRQSSEGNLGTSFISHQQASRLLQARAPAT